LYSLSGGAAENQPCTDTVHFTGTRVASSMPGERCRPDECPILVLTPEKTIN
jgi:hypothetical protein